MFRPYLTGSGSIGSWIPRLCLFLFSCGVAAAVPGGGGGGGGARPRPSATKMLGVGILGISHIHRQDIVKALSERSDIKVTAVWDASPALAAEIAAKLGCRSVLQPDDVVSAPDTGAVIIAGETSLHKPLVIAAAKFRKHIFIEKPVATDLPTAKLLAKTIEESGVMFHTGYFLRELPAVKRLQELMRQKAFGRVVRVRIKVTHTGLLNGWFDAIPWMTNREQAGYGGFGDLGLHAVDLLNLWLGTPVRVAAVIERQPGSTIDDYGEALLRYSDGAIASIAAGWAEQGTFFQVNVHGSDAHATLTQGKLVYTRAGQTETVDDRQPDATDGVRRYLEALANNSPEGLVSLNEMVESVALMERVYGEAAQDD